jgi:hypothetical protein
MSFFERFFGARSRPKQQRRGFFSELRRTASAAQAHNVMPPTRAFQNSAASKVARSEAVKTVRQAARKFFEYPCRNDPVHFDRSSTSCDQEAWLKFFNEVRPRVSAQ